MSPSSIEAMSPYDPTAPDDPEGWIALVLADHARRFDPAPWVELTEEPTGDARVLLITFNDRPASWIRNWAAVAACRPKSVAVISCQFGGDQSAELASIRAALDIDDDAVSMRSINRPGGLARFGVHISDQLSQWSGDDGQIIVQWRSLSTVLQYVELERLFRFLTLLRSRIVLAGAHGYFQLDPGAHDHETVDTIRVVFDRVIDGDR